VCHGPQMNLHHGLPEVIQQIPDTLACAERGPTSGSEDSWLALLWDALNSEKI